MRTSSTELRLRVAPKIYSALSDSAAGIGGSSGHRDGRIAFADDTAGGES